jgi:hypothetical protein
VLQEFKEFVLRGNVVDMAVGIIIGTAFSTIVKSLVDDISYAANSYAASRRRHRRYRLLRPLHQPGRRRSRVPGAAGRELRPGREPVLELYASHYRVTHIPVLVMAPWVCSAEV